MFGKSRNFRKNVYPVFWVIFPNENGYMVLSDLFQI